MEWHHGGCRRYVKSSCKCAVLVVEGALRVARASATSLSVATLLRVALLIAVLMVALLITCLVVAERYAGGNVQLAHLVEGEGEGWGWG